MLRRRQLSRRWRGIWRARRGGRPWERMTNEFSYAEAAATEKERGDSRTGARDAAQRCGIDLSNVCLPETKDARGAISTAAHGVVQKAIEGIRAAKLKLLVITDVCLCEYTDHG